MLAPESSSFKVDRTLHVTQPAHSVRLLKLIDTTARAQAPVAKILTSTAISTGTDAEFTAAGESDDNPVLMYRWDFGDGTTAEGKHVTHAFTRPGNYDVALTAVGLSEVSAKAKVSISVTGSMSTRFHPETQRRLSPDAQ